MLDAAAASLASRSSDPTDVIGFFRAHDMPVDDADHLLRTVSFPLATDGHFAFAYVDVLGRAERVRLVHGLAGYRAPVWFEPVGDGLHVAALADRQVARAEYRFEVFHVDGTSETILDPFNPFIASDPFSRHSVVCGPGACCPTAARPPARGAIGTMTAVEGRDSSGPWTAHVWSPPGVTAKAPLPMLFVPDGADSVRFGATDRLLANLVADGRIAPCRAAFVPPRQRLDDYAADSTFPAHVREIMATVGGAMSVTRWVGLGVSLGGLALLHAHTVDDALFGGLILQSSSFFHPDFDEIEHGFRHFERIRRFVDGIATGAMRIRPIPMALTCGSGGENLANNRAVAGRLRERGVPLTFTVHPDAHNWTSWRDALGPALEGLLGRDGRPDPGTSEAHGATRAR